MPFYKFLLKAGHVGKTYYQEFPIVLFAKSYTEAIKAAKGFPMIKHHNRGVVISSSIVDEQEFIENVVQDSYGRTYENEQRIIPLLECVKRLSYVRNYEFVTEDGKQLKNFCDTYRNASKKVKDLVEKEYVEWAENIINSQDEVLTI